MKNDNRLQTGPLNGWRAIADYLGRNQSTVKRWAADGGLTVHRPKGSAARKGVPVYAFAGELDAWLRGREAQDDQAAPEASVGDSEAAEVAPAPAPPMMNRRYLTGFAVALAVAGGGAVWWPKPPRVGPCSLIPTMPLLRRYWPLSNFTGCGR